MGSVLYKGDLRFFSASEIGPAERWVADITYIRTAEGWLHFAIVLDLFPRRLVGWSMAKSLETSIVPDKKNEAGSSTIHPALTGPEASFWSARITRTLVTSKNLG